MFTSVADGAIRRGRRVAAATFALLLVVAVTGITPVANAATDGSGQGQVAVVAAPSIDIEKATNGVDADVAPGPSVRVVDPVTWTYVVTNTGNVPLTDVVVVDKAPIPSLDPTPVYVSGDDGNGVLDPGEAWTYQASSVAFWDSRNQGQYRNDATVTALFGDTEVSDTDASHYLGTLYCPQTGDIVINLGVPDGIPGELGDLPGVRKAGPFAAPVPAGYYSVTLASYDDHIVKGGQFQDEEQYAIQLSNDGGVLYTSPLSPDIPENLDFVVSEVDSLFYLPEAATSLTALHSSLIGTSTTINSLVALCVAFDVVAPPAIGIEKATNGVDADTPTGPAITVGDPVTWTYVVTNEGGVPLSDVTVTDDQGVVPVYQSGDDGDGVLEPGEAWTYSATGTAVAGQYANVGKVTATGPNQEPVSATDPSHYVGVSNPAIDIVKTLTNEGGFVPLGGTATFEIVVTNTGDVDLTDVTVTDPLTPACDRSIGALAVGASSTYTCDATNVTASFTNVADVVGTGPQGEKVTDTDPEPVTVVAASGLIGDTVWHDVNKNGKQDPGEKGIAGAKVKLTNLDTNEESFQTTNSDGKYLFSALPAGRYRVELVKSSVSGELTTPGVFTPTLAEGEASLTNDFGLADALPNTGIDTDVLLLMAAVLLAGGAVMLTVTRRRDDLV